MSDTEVLELTDKDWEASVEKSEVPVAAMFYSPTCAHCRTMEPYFREYASEYEGRVKFVRLNVAANPWTLQRYGVRGTPTFTFFCGGKPVSELVGAIYPALLKKRIEEALIYGEECAENTTEINYEITGYA
ncbi:MAG: thioredoxin family protein [Methanomicrobiaceae archaeon]|nr:thioredoxin family protein [Methanomicrobiaceae archaeon]